MLRMPTNVCKTRSNAYGIGGSVVHVAPLPWIIKACLIAEKKHSLQVLDVSQDFWSIA